MEKVLAQDSLEVKNGNPACIFFEDALILDSGPELCSGGSMTMAISLEDLNSRMRIPPEETARRLERYIQDRVDRLERDGVILGLSGGVDSAVLAVLCRRALGPGRTLALMMPERDSRPEHIRDALSLAESWGIETRRIDLTPHLRKLNVYDLLPLSRVPLAHGLRAFANRKLASRYRQKTGESVFAASLTGLRGNAYGRMIGRRTAYFRVKQRLRMVVLYLYGEIENRLVAEAANRSEYLIGYFVKHGCDHAADILPLLHLYKTQVRELARFLGIVPRIIDKPPSPDHIPGVLDEAAIGIPYEQLDLILLGRDLGWDAEDIARALSIDRKKIEDVETMVRRSEHMRTLDALEPPPPAGGTEA